MEFAGRYIAAFARIGKFKMLRLCDNAAFV
jgi:hypothetical protein